MDIATDTQTTDIAPLDPEAGVPRVLIIVRDIDGDPAGQSAFDLAAHLVGQGIESQMLSGGGRLLNSLLRRKVIHVEWQVPGDGPLGTMQATRRIAQMIRDNNYNIVHVFGRIVPGPIRSACQKTGAKMIASVPGTYPTTGWREGRRTKALTKADHFIAPSAYVRGYLRDELDVPESKISTISPGIDLGHFNPGAVKGQRMIELVRHYGIPEEHRIILMPARMLPWKGQRKVIEAFARLNPKNTTLLIAGDSSLDSAYADALQTQVEEARMAGQIRFLDLIDDMPALYMLSDVVVEAPEEPVAFARATVEAQAMGRPAVTSAVGSGPEAVRNGKTGWTAAPGDVDGVTLALKKALELEPEARKQLALAARSHARETFDLGVCMAQVEAIYADILE